MKIECIIAKWIMEKLQSENLITEDLSNSAMEKFLQNFPIDEKGSEPKGEAA